VSCSVFPAGARRGPHRRARDYRGRHNYLPQLVLTHGLTGTCASTATAITARRALCACSSSSLQPTVADSCATACASSCFSKTGRWGHKTLPRTPLLFRFATPKNHPSAYPVIDAITACEWKKTRRGGNSGPVDVCFVGVVSGLLHTRGKTLVAALTEIDRQLRPDFSSLNHVTTKPRSVGTLSLCTANSGTKPMSTFAFIPFSCSIMIDGDWALNAGMARSAMAAAVARVRAPPCWFSRWVTSCWP
jgi:hypothetical protein